MRRSSFRVPSTTSSQSRIASAFTLFHEVSRLSVHHAGLCGCGLTGAGLSLLTFSFMFVPRTLILHAPCRARLLRRTVILHPRRTYADLSAPRGTPKRHM